VVLHLTSVALPTVSCRIFSAVYCSTLVLILVLVLVDVITVLQIPIAPIVCQLVFQVETSSLTKVL
jgi:hypothetical protein